MINSTGARCWFACIVFQPIGRQGPLARPQTWRSVAGATSVALLCAGCGGGVNLPFTGGGNNGPKDDAATAGAAFLSDWSAGNLTAAADRTTEPTQAHAALDELATRLRPDKRTFAPGKVSNCGDSAPCTMPFHADLLLNAMGDWNYDGRLSLVHQQVGATKKWLVAWSPSVIHPLLTDDTTLARVRHLPPRAAILDRSGRALVDNQPVVKVGVKAGDVPDGTIEKLADLLDVNVDGLTTRTNQAQDGQFVEAVVLRKSDYLDKKASLDQIGGVVTQDGTLSLAPTRAFAREVLGTVATATAASLQNAGPTASAADSVGSFGLQAIYQKQLAGRPRGEIDLVKRDTRAVVSTLSTFAEVPGSPVHTTLDLTVQRAAENAVALTGENSSLVAIDIRTGDILAVANGPADKAGEDRALNGQYAPGSTFKIVTAAALLAGGLEPTDTVNCPSSITVDGKKFTNYDGLGSLGEVSFSRDFEESCNTAFIGQAMKLPDDAVSNTADLFGIGEDWDLVLDSYSGNVPPAASPTEQAADAIGQGKVLMSPLAMAVVAAAVAAGTPYAPHLVTSGPPPAVAPTVGPSGAPTLGPDDTDNTDDTDDTDDPDFQATPDETPMAYSSNLDVTPSPSPSATYGGDVLAPLEYATALRNLMYATVKSGTATVLKIKGEKVGAKTGTAEYGSEVQPGKHAWMVGFMGNIAFAVIVERGDTGATTAGPLAKSFLTDVKGYNVPARENDN
jgi:cell division protein FtsI/penicillin-binding protein 2